NFYFQAEDGIRYYHVTGVQTCALPIYHLIKFIAWELSQRRTRVLPRLLFQEYKGQSKNLAYYRAKRKNWSIRFGEHFQLESFASDRKSTRLNSSHVKISYAVFCLKKKT